MHLTTTNTDAGAKLEYGQLAYQMLMVARVKYVNDLLQQGISVLIADVDAVWRYSLSSNHCVCRLLLYHAFSCRHDPWPYIDVPFTHTHTHCWFLWGLLGDRHRRCLRRTTWLRRWTTATRTSAGDSCTLPRRRRRRPFGRPCSRSTRGASPPCRYAQHTPARTRAPTHTL